MNIGQAAAASGISSKMIRHYETIGLIRSADRTESGYRTYDRSDVETLRFIRRSRDLGFQVEQIRDLLALWRDRNRASADVKKVALDQIAELEAKMQQLQDMANTLRHLAQNCHGDSRPDCPILQDMASNRQQTCAQDAPRKGKLLHGTI